MRTKTTLLLFLFLLLLAASHPAIPAQAATITVSTSDDEVNEDGDCSLREAIIAANTDTAVDACPAGDGADHIELPAATYTLTITGANNDDATRGDLDILDDLTITGEGRASTIIDANGDDRAVHILVDAGSVEISRLTVRGSHPSYIGAILVDEGTLNLVNSRVSENEDIGVAVYQSAVLNVVNSRIYSNEQGGLLLTQNATATVLNSTVSGNNGYGGAGISNAGYLFVVNSTISGNSASNNGGGIYNAHQLPDTVLINATVTGNSADASDGGGIDSEWGTTTVKNSIIAGNLRDGATQPSDCSGDVESEGYNLIQSTSGCTITGETGSNITGVDPMLGPLQDNGGPTVTHALLGGSPAVDAGDPTGCDDAVGAPLTTDQRGYVRPVDGGGGNQRCDIGAFEYDSGGPRPKAFVVTYTDDDGDINPGDARCDVFPALPGNQCSLRGAIEEINALGLGDAPIHINFDIPGSVPGLFRPSSPLPEITVPIFIDGATQPGAACPTATTPANLQIVLDGTFAGADENGIVLAAGSDGSTIQGLVIGNFDDDGINISSNINRVRCNHIGVAADGESPMGNGVTGIFVGGDENEIGGDNSDGARNVISANGRPLQLYGSANRIRNNFMGTTADGMNALGNNSGIVISHDDNIIGGNNPLARNVISGGGDYALYISSADNTRIIGNYIGVARDGITPLPNTGDGITIFSNSIGNMIGGTDAGEGNIIAYNDGNGVELSAHRSLVPEQNTIRGNAIHDNSALGIALRDGSNRGQIPPTLASTPDRLTVSGTLDGQPNSTFHVDLYRNQQCDPSGYGEGQEYLYTIDVSTDASGQSEFSVDLPPAAVLPGDYITATATDAEDNTSEFSACVQLEFVPPPTATPTSTVTPGPSPTPTATGTPNTADEHIFLPIITR